MKRALETFYYKELAFIVVAAFFALFTSHLSMPTFFVDLLLIWFVLKTGQLIGQDTERNHEFQNAVKELGEYHKLTSTKKDKAKGGVVMASDKFPRFFDVDGVLVVLFKEGDDVFGKTAS